MTQDRRTNRILVTLLLAGFLLAASFTALAKEKYERIEAVALGESTQLGRHASITIIIYEFSTADDQKNLFEAFKADGPKGLHNAVSKLQSHGRIAISGTLGFDIKYIREFKQPDGSRKLRMVTDRPIRFGEAWSDSRSSDYNLSAFEIILSPEKGKSTGTLLPVMQLKVNDKTGEIELEAFQNPWKLTNISDYLPD
ncbi:MAG: hypothetical protein KA419_01325 [Acidobacteria bacterium]|nr:hypothetical protein [Acidobacteriota bacterium]